MNVDESSAGIIRPYGIRVSKCEGKSREANPNSMRGGLQLTRHEDPTVVSAPYYVTKLAHKSAFHRTAAQISGALEDNCGC